MNLFLKKYLRGQAQVLRYKLGSLVRLKRATC